MNYDNTNRGVLFKADKKGNERRPDYTGTVNVEGAEYQLSAWIKHSKAGAAYMSLSVQRPRPRSDDGRPENRAPVQSSGDDFNDEIPFS
jgi:hypothetical protein